MVVQRRGQGEKVLAMGPMGKCNRQSHAHHQTSPVGVTEEGKGITLGSLGRGKGRFQRGKGGGGSRSPSVPREGKKKAGGIQVLLGPAWEATCSICSHSRVHPPTTQGKEFRAGWLNHVQGLAGNALAIKGKGEGEGGTGGIGGVMSPGRNVFISAWEKAANQVGVRGEWAGSPPNIPIFLSPSSCSPASLWELLWEGGVRACVRGKGRGQGRGPWAGNKLGRRWGGEGSPLNKTE